MKSSKSRISKEVAIKLSNVSKKYLIHHDKPTLAERLVNGRNEEFWALKNINLTINQGEHVGIIGANGSGKTTLLKLISGITAPTAGSVAVNGKVVSLIDLEAGFHPDLTGIQNIYLNGTILGMSRSKIDAKIKEIIDFADIGKFIDVPLYTYSGGMVLRLGFSVAIHSDPDILVLDENLSVGDQDFQRKSYEKISGFMKTKRTLVMTSHILNTISRVCKRVIHLSNGKVLRNGNTAEVINNYKKIYHN